MMKTGLQNFILVSLLFHAGIAAAMSPGAALKKLNNKYKDVKTMRVEFREVFEWGLTGETNIRFGEILVTSDNRFRIDTVDLLIVCDGTDVYRYNRTRGQVIIEKTGADDSQLLPHRILLEFARDFEARSLTELAVEDRNGFRLDMTAKDSEASLMASAVIWATSEDFVVHRLKMVDLNSNSTTYYLSKIEFDKPVEISETTFSTPENVEIFDLR